MTAEYDPHQTLINAFSQLRRRGMSLSIADLLEGERLIDGEFGVETPAEFKATLKLLWCRSPETKVAVDEVWQSAVVLKTESQPKNEEIPQDSAEPPDTRDTSQPPVADHDSRRLPEPESQTAPADNQPKLGTMPIQPPAYTPPLDDAAESFDAYWPIPRRLMGYAWRYLRRPIADGAPTIVDIPATVAQIARQGFFLEPAFRREESNHAHLILLVDQNGSMMPFHRFSRDIVATARDESDIRQVDVFYFHNAPHDTLFRDPHLMNAVPLDRALAECNQDTSIIIVSDGGAARGYRNLKRIRTVTRFIAVLKRHTGLIAWLNPMPQPRWSGSSAQIIAHLIPMFAMNEDGFSQAIDVVRGQPFTTG